MYVFIVGKGRKNSKTLKAQSQSAFLQNTMKLSLCQIIVIFNVQLIVEQISFEYLDDLKRLDGCLVQLTASHAGGHWFKPHRKEQTFLSFKVLLSFHKIRLPFLISKVEQTKDSYSKMASKDYSATKETGSISVKLDRRALKYMRVGY